MAIFSGGKSTAIDSPRHLTIRHARKLVAAATGKREAKRPILVVRGDGVGSDDSEEEKLNPGEEKLNSYWAPGLAAGPRHRVNVTQIIDANNAEREELTLTAEQDFFVDAPQFSLPSGSVHSVYPPSGYSDDHRILPHVVLTDPHLPWERRGSPKSVALAAAAKPGEPARNRVPWLVVFSFSQDELRLPPGELDGPQSIFRNTSSGVIKPVKQSSTMTVNMSIADLWVVAPPGSDDVTTPITKDLGDPTVMSKERGDFIFVKPDLFTSLFSPFDKDGKRQVPEYPDTVPYQFLAHVRKINPAGMALAGVEDTAIFSIVVGNRSGPLDNALPTTVTAHLVAIEGVEALRFPIKARYVALCSLYSWNYTVMPPNMLNVREAFKHLGSTLDLLRAPESIVAPLRQASDKISRRIAGRLDDGYTLVQYQTQTGEPTVAMFRGPFTPTYVHDLDNLTKCSNSGVDLQILDQDIGIMDITYSVAWQVGRTLALGDESFTAALVRLRTAISGSAIKAAKTRTIKDIDDRSIRTRKEVLADLPNVVKSLASIHIGHPPPPPPSFGDEPEPPPSFVPGAPKKRWQRHRLTRREIPDLSLTAPAIQEKYSEEALKAARRLAQSTDGGIYNETNDPQSTDWMTVLLWLVDRMFLAGVPAHCLIPDPSYLGQESLRFFRIDPNWVDALVDGALSLGNHQGTDLDRVAIKKALNDYINYVDPETGHKTQIPTYGFYLRSDLVTMFPDLRVQVLVEKDDPIRPREASDDEPPAGAPLLRHEIVADGVMMGFMDRVPGSPDFSRLLFTQPPHQQRFAAAGFLDTDKIEVDVRRQYTVDQKTRETDKHRNKALITLTNTPQGEMSTDSLFTWSSVPGSGLSDLRILRLPRYADLQLQKLQEMMPKYYDQGVWKPYFEDDAATSALLAMELNDPIYNLTISLTGAATALSVLGPPPGITEGVRTLKQLEPVRVDKPRNVHDESDEPAAATHGDSGSGDDGEWIFERPENQVAGPSFTSPHLAPHVRVIPSLAQPGAGAKPGPTRRIKDAADGPADAPKYQIQIASNVTGGTKEVELQDPNLPQDLIFSIIVEQDPVNQYKLVEMDLQIYLGPPPKTPDDTMYLMERYEGPGIAMLTNLRFNALTMNTLIDGVPCLLVRLLPRAAKGWIAMTTVKEMGVMLSLAQVNDTNSRVRQLRVKSWAVYLRDLDSPRIGDTETIENKDTIVTILNPKYPTA